MGVNINKNGVIKGELLSEFAANTFDKQYYVEPDGSAWVRVIHHNNPASVRFANNNTFSSQVYLDEDRWLNSGIFTKVNKYELMVKQMTTSGGTEVKYRWIQSASPLTATFENTKEANVTKITTAGYTNSTNYGGMYVLGSTNTYYCCNNGTNGNWFGAFGCQAVWSGGLPGYGGSAVTTGYMDLYLRIDNLSSLTQTSIGKDYVISKEFYEI